MEWSYGEVHLGYPHFCILYTVGRPLMRKLPSWLNKARIMDRVLGLLPACSTI